MTLESLLPRNGRRALVLALALTVLVYWAGLHGSWLFDDYPNIVDNHGIQITHSDLSSLINAALSSPASDFKRPLASLSFAANYRIAGLDPFSMKLTNLVIHLLNGVLVYFLGRQLLELATPSPSSERHGRLAAWLAMAWMLLPINLTAVLYVVQRMESLANLFVLAGLLGYLAGRRRMLHEQKTSGAWLCLISVVLATGIGLLAKETAVLLPLYALCIEWIAFDFGKYQQGRRDRKIIGVFVLTLLLPMLIGLAWLLPHLWQPDAWAVRDFTMKTRMLSELRITASYIGWILAPLPHELSF